MSIYLFSSFVKSTEIKLEANINKYEEIKRNKRSVYVWNKNRSTLCLIKK